MEIAAEPTGTITPEAVLSRQASVRRARTGTTVHVGAAGDSVLLHVASEDDVSGLIERGNGTQVDVVKHALLKRPISPKELSRALLIACRTLPPEERAAQLAAALPAIAAGA